MKSRQEILKSLLDACPIKDQEDQEDLINSMADVCHSYYLTGYKDVGKDILLNIKDKI